MAKGAAFCQLCCAAMYAGPACSAGSSCHCALCRYLSVADADGQERTCHVVLAFWIADRKGANALLNVKHWPAKLCDTWDLVPKKEMHKVRKTFRRRTATQMRQVRRLQQSSSAPSSSWAVLTLCQAELVTPFCWEQALHWAEQRCTCLACADEQPEYVSKNAAILCCGCRSSRAPRTSWTRASMQRPLRDLTSTPCTHLRW